MENWFYEIEITGFYGEVRVKQVIAGGAAAHGGDARREQLCQQAIKAYKQLAEERSHDQH
jgi:hypothetical protein